ncbi:MAG: hypothetical protein ABSC55_10565 [Syntrophorhabdales bacterium]|jgi:hypothetical protein
MNRITYALLALLISVSVINCYAGKQYVSKDKLPCGEAEVTAETMCTNIPQIATECTKQTIQLIDPSKDISVRLPHEGKLVKKSVLKKKRALDAFVTSWTCLKSNSGISYVLLWYTCSFGDERPDCIGVGREWERIFSLDGKDVTAGFRKQDPRLPELYHRLGLSEVIDKGIHLKSVQY